jgi:hypothetical protein
MSVSRKTQLEQARLMAALLDPANRTLAAAAAAAGVQEKTARRWRQDPAFAAALDKAHGQALDDVGGRLVAMLPACERTMLAVMLDPLQRASVRLRAAQTLAELTLRLYEARTLERRLSALEAAQGSD